jgi:hypothetical protein
MPEQLGRSGNAIGFPNWIRAHTGRQDAIGALARVVVAEEARRGKRFYGAGDLFNALQPKGGPALRPALDRGLAEWRLLHLPQVRFAVANEGWVAALTGAEVPLVRKGNYREPHAYPRLR